jgi:hypothetical protein
MVIIMVRAWEFMEAIPVDPNSKVHDTLIDDELSDLVFAFEHILDNKSDDYSIPADQIMSNNQIKSGLDYIQYLLFRLNTDFPTNRSLTKLCNQMKSYLNGKYLDWS